MPEPADDIDSPGPIGKSPIGVEAGGESPAVALDRVAPDPAEVVIRATGLEKSYAGTPAVDGVNLEIRAGEVFCVVGPNGAGKTTLLYLLGGVVYPSSGHVAAFGMHRWKRNFEIRKRSTFLPAQTIHGASPNPFQYFALLARVYGMDRESFRDRVERLCADMNFAPHLRKDWGRLSYGLRKKAGLVGAFLPDARLRILDEPFAGGIDPLGADALSHWIRSSRARGETLIFSTQELGVAEPLADRFAVMNEGRIVALGTARELARAAGVEPGEGALARAFRALTGGRSFGDERSARERES